MRLFPKTICRVPHISLLRCGFLLAAILFCIPGCNNSPVPSPAQASTTLAPSTNPEPVETRPFTTTGPLVAEQQADVAAERDGRITRINVEIGDHVRQGQLLAALDDRALRTAVDAQSARLSSLRAQVGEWEAEQKMDQADLRRADEMRTNQILSEENWEHVKYKLDEVVAEVARYRADLTASEADLASARLQLSQSQIAAPFTGVIGRRTLHLSQDVKKGEPLFWITSIAPLRILFTVPESAMSAYTLNAPLELTTPDYPDLHQPARILRVSPVVDPASGSIQVIGTVPHPSPLLKPGMSMQIALASDPAK